MSVVDPVIVSVIRRAWPQIIAQSIIGVQPMTRSTGQIFNMKPRYFGFKFRMIDKRYFKNFLRLNDKRMAFSVEAIKKASYPIVELSSTQVVNFADMHQWCNENIGEFTHINNGYNLFVFSDVEYATAFKLAWAE